MSRRLSPKPPSVTSKMNIANALAISKPIGRSFRVESRHWGRSDGVLVE